MSDPRRKTDSSKRPPSQARRKTVRVAKQKAQTQAMNLAKVQKILEVDGLDLDASSAEGMESLKKAKQQIRQENNLFQLPHPRLRKTRLIVFFSSLQVLSHRRRMADGLPLEITRIANPEELERLRGRQARKKKSLLVPVLVMSGLGVIALSLLSVLIVVSMNGPEDEGSPPNGVAKPSGESTTTPSGEPAANIDLGTLAQSFGFGNDQGPEQAPDQGSVSGEIAEESDIPTPAATASIVEVSVSATSAEPLPIVAEVITLPATAVDDVSTDVAAVPAGFGPNQRGGGMFGQGPAARPPEPDKQEEDPKADVATVAEKAADPAAKDGASENMPKVEPKPQPEPEPEPGPPVVWTVAKAKKTVSGRKYQDLFVGPPSLIEEKLVPSVKVGDVYEVMIPLKPEKWKKSGVVALVRHRESESQEMSILVQDSHNKGVKIASGTADAGRFSPIFARVPNDYKPWRDKWQDLKGFAVRSPKPFWLAAATMVPQGETTYSVLKLGPSFDAKRAARVKCQGKVSLSLISGNALFDDELSKAVAEMAGIEEQQSINAKVNKKWVRSSFKPSLHLVAGTAPGVSVVVADGTLLNEGVSYSQIPRVWSRVINAQQSADRTVVMALVDGLKGDSRDEAEDFWEKMFSKFTSRRGAEAVLVVDLRDLTTDPGTWVTGGRQEALRRLAEAVNALKVAE